MNNVELLELVAEILETEAVELSDVLDDRGWDSLSNLTFIAEVDDRTGKSIDATALAQATTVADLLALANKPEA